MKRLNAYFGLLTIFFLLGACIPDSLTKFREDPPQTQSPTAEGGSGGGSGLPTPPANCTAGVSGGGGCTPPTALTYPDAPLSVIVGAPVFIVPLLLGGVDNTIDFTTFSVSPALPNTLTIDAATGIISGTVDAYIASTNPSWTVTASYFGTTTATVTFALNIEAGRTYTGIEYPQLPSEKLVLYVSDASQFAVAGAITNASGALGTVNHVDEANNILHVTLQASTVANFQPGDAIDNSTTFFAQEATINTGVTSVVYAFDRTLGIPVAFGARVLPTLSGAELTDTQFSVSPALHEDLTLNADGSISYADIGTLNNNIPPTTYTVTAVNHVGSAASQSVNLSVSNPATPKQVEKISFPQPTGQALIVTLNSVANFVSDTDITSADGNRATIRFVDEASNRLFLSVHAANTGLLEVGDVLDDAATYTKTEGTVTDIEFAFDLDTAGNLNLIPNVHFYGEAAVPSGLAGGGASADANVNTLEWQIDPGFADDTNLVFESTGEIRLDPLKPNLVKLSADTTYTIKVKSLLETSFADPGVTTTTLKFRIEQAPTHLSVTESAILTLDTVTPFQVGQKVSSPMPAPFAGTALGLVRRVFSADNKILVDIIQGHFRKIDETDVLEPNRTLDNVREYAVSRAQVLSQDNVSAMIHLNSDPGAGNALPGDILTFGGAPPAKTGVIVYVDENNPPVDRQQIYIRSTNDADADAFPDGPAIESAIDQTAPSFGTINIDYIESNNIILTLSAVGTAFVPGVDVMSQTTAGITALPAAGTPGIGVANYVNGTAHHVTVERGIYDVAGTVDDANPFNASNGNVDQIQHEHSFQLYRSKETSLESTLLQGDNVNYFVTPALPAGLTLDTSTGTISGTPTDSMNRTQYTLRAINGVGEVYLTFYLRVHNHFQLINLTENASSFIMHKEGQNRNITDCRITEDQYDAGVARGTNEFRGDNCRLEAGELDLFASGLRYQIFSSPGMCEHISYTPYAYYKLRPSFEVETGPTPKYIQVAGNTACNGAVAMNPLDGFVNGNKPCQGDYSTIDGALPNCAEGEYELEVVTWNVDPADPGNMAACTASTNTTPSISCGGKANNCLAGPVKQTNGFTGFENSNYGSLGAVFYPAEFGLLEIFDYSAPLSKASITVEEHTRDLANFVLNTDCNPNNYRYNSTNFSQYRSPSQQPTVRKITLPSNLSFTFNAGDAIATDDGSSTGTVLYRISSSNDAGVYSSLYINVISGNFPADDDPTTNDNSNEISNGGVNDIGIVSSVNVATDPYKGSARPFYTVNCLDAAFNTKAQIRLQVREWNRDFTGDDDVDFIDVSGGTDYMDTTALDAFGNSYNQESDWDDFTPTITGCVPGGAPTFNHDDPLTFPGRGYEPNE